MGRRLLDALTISDQDIQRLKGIDAVQYLTFQRYLIYFLSLLTVICILIVLPINLQGNLRKFVVSLYEHWIDFNILLTFFFRGCKQTIC